MIAELAHELLPYAAALYVFDSVVRVREGDFGFLAPWGRKFRRRGPGWHAAGLLPTSEVLLSDARATSDAGPEQDVAEARARRAIQSRQVKPLSVLSTLLFLAMFGALPAAVYRYHDIPAAADAAFATAAVLWMAVLVVAARGLRKGGATRAATATALAPAIFFPPAAAHVLSFMWRDFYRGIAPLAVAAALLSPAELRRAARQDLRRFEEDARRAAGTPAETEANASRARLSALLAATGIEWSEAAADDAPLDAQAAVFCPLCEAEYRSGFVRCTDCEVPLKPFAASPGL